MLKGATSAVQQLDKLYKGKNWMGISFTETIAAIDAGLAFRQPPGGRNSIAAIVRHIGDWNLFAYRKLQNDAQFDIDQEAAFDMQAYETDITTSWEALKKYLFDMHVQLLQIVPQLPAQQWEEQVSGRSYDKQQLLYGILEHDAYHLGQIVLLKNQLVALPA